mmetsp:Transcript_14198/g.17975  ORF Transcript_14198/g.17975 Transcript_14198/m.17975 type:complete len:118 (-) Transcript_14198:35-388(-)|eukprot:CAMPEP_0206192652 /NCGR_PEP_ID=MMETSP0166-20121206/6086_1 /ASSEMBLY_ACC=CAM_ASM_000260 /TAXON_ID=95228 /ORGANISM="Vannella robusta, Strain DIVA3 518/3/11/1/6" /LENGTH=117 /DNA_ID=CAMNT_0053609189 /DNA_START=1370 /DNA_END=1723 /DNA_ORIENTATION=+
MAWNISTLDFLVGSNATLETLELRDSYPRLTGLSTIECDTLSDFGFKSLARSKTLTWLEVGSKGVTDRGIDWLLNMASLKKLNVVSNTTNITKEHVEASIESRRPDLKWKFAQLAIK